MPITKNLEKTINNPQFKIIYLNIDDTTDKWEETLNKYQLNMNPVVHFRLINQDSFLAKTMDLQAIPRFLLINKDGIIINDNAPSPINPALVQTIKRLLN